MSYFLHDGKIDLNSVFSLSGAEAAHLSQSRRIRSGETVRVQDSDGRRFIARVESIGKKGVVLQAIEESTPPEESPLRITLFQSLVKEKAVDFIIQKATELGVSNIVFFHSQNSQRLKVQDGIDKKIDRWQKIALEACKQSERLNPPSIYFLNDLAKFQQFCAESSIETQVNICLESSAESVPLKTIKIQGDSINVLIGPEGGWGNHDLENVPKTLIQLGPRVLRSDTAAISVVSILQYLWGDLGVAPEEMTLSIDKAELYP